MMMIKKQSICIQHESRGGGVNEVIIKLDERVKFHVEQLNYMMTTTREMHKHEGAIKELMELIEYFEQNYDSMP